MAEETTIPEPAKEPVTPVVMKVAQQSDATTAVLQWLAYSFWGWTVLTIGYLVGLTASYTLGNSYSTISPVIIPSSIAAAVILLIIASVTDYFYSKREVEHKTGISMVLMVIHAVLFGLLAVGSLITIAFSLIQWTVGGSSGSIGAQVAAITAGTLFVTYVLILLRVVRPFIFSKFRLLFNIAFLLIVGLLAVLAISGPVIQTAKLKNDRAVATAVTSLETSVQRFVTAEGRLPKDLDELLTDGNVTERSDQAVPIADLVKENRVTYTPNATADETSKLSRILKTHTYKLCGVYDYPAEKSKSSYSVYTNGRMTRSTAGEHCQTLDATSYTLLNK